MTVLAVTPIPEEYEAFTKALADFGHAGVCRGVGKLTATAFDDGKIIVAQGGLGKAQFGVQTQHLIDNPGQHQRSGLRRHLRAAR